MPGETFGERLLAVRLTKTINDKPVSQETAARLFCASLAAYRSWEKNRRLPMAIYRMKITEFWPEVFS
jgi:hypothetical protein